MVSRVLKLSGSGRKADEPGPIDDCQESQAVGSFFEVVRPAEGEGEMIARDMKLNDDKSPLIDLISCIVCNETMKLEKSAPDSGGKDIIQINIVASDARELSECDYYAEVEMAVG